MTVREYFKLKISVTLLLLGTLESVLCQTADTLIVSPRVGKVIDRAERITYNLFPAIQGYQTAVVLRLVDDTNALDITSVDPKTGETKVIRFPQLYAQVEQLGNRIDGRSNSPSGSKTGQVIIYAKPYNLSGPRIGLTILSDQYIQTIRKKYGKGIEPMVAQFGWHTETRFFTVRSGFTAVSEWVTLIGGFNQELFLPSLTWLVGVRTPSGFEFGGGPNVSLSGTAYVLATGITLSAGEVAFPINLALASSKSGLRFTFLVGFTMKEQ